SGALSGTVFGSLFSRWQLAGFSEWESGQPFTITTGADTAGAGGAVDPPQSRPDYNPVGALVRDPVENSLRTFQSPKDGTGRFVTPLNVNGNPLTNSMPGGGNLGRNTLRGPSFANWNFSLAKTVAVREGWRIQLRADWINLWNHRNFGPPISS